MPAIEIDEDRREVRAGVRAVSPQPKVFELLVYLARHRQRVVPKAELLDAVWPGVVVTEASLQRAISLARTALADKLARRPELTSTPGLGALVARARGELLAAGGEREAGIRHLRAAARSNHAANAPLACAEVRRALGRALLAGGDLDAAEVELNAAASLFRRAGAAGQVALCEAVSRELATLRSAAG